MRPAHIRTGLLVLGVLALSAGPCFATDIPPEVDQLFGSAEVIALFTTVKGNVTPSTIFRAPSGAKAGFDFHVRPRVKLRVKQPLLGCRRGQVWDLPTPRQTNVWQASAGGARTPWYLRDGQDVLASLRKEHGEYVAFYARPVVSGTLKLDLYDPAGWSWATERLPVGKVLNIVAGAVWRWHRAETYDAPGKTTAQLVADLGDNWRLSKVIVDELVARRDAATLGDLLAKARRPGSACGPPLIIKALNRIPGAAPVPYLIPVATATEGPWNLWTSAIEALARPEAKAAVPPLIGLLQRADADRSLRNSVSRIAKTLVAIGDPDGIGALLQKADEPAMYREAAAIITALAPSADPRVGPFLREHLYDFTVGAPYFVPSEHDDFGVMTAAAMALAKRGDDAGFARLVELRPDWQDLKPAFIAEVLGKLGDKRAVPVLLDILAAADDYLIYEFTAEALAKIHDDRAVGPLIEAAKRAGANARGSVVGAVATWDRPEVRAFLLQQLGSDDPGAICAAAVGLSRFGLSQGVDRLLALLKDGLKDWDRGDRLRLYWALGHIKDQRTVPELIAAMHTRPDDCEDIAYALRSITGADLPSRPEPWQTWWRSERAEGKRR